eukprot:682203-Pleurochrysis_carterae.AAC.1
MLLSASGSHDAAALGTTSCRASLERKMRITAAYSWTVLARIGSPRRPGCNDPRCRMRSTKSSMVSAL